MVELGYSDQRLKNVGALYEVYQFPCCSSKRYLVGSVVYLGGRTCLMSVNCFKSRSMEFFLKFGFNGSFKIIDGIRMNLGTHNRIDVDALRLPFFSGFQVSFEVEDGQHTFFDVKEWLVHPDYSKDKMVDIGMLCLSKSVQGLEGLKPYYDFGKHPFSSGNQLKKLLYAGYGHGGNNEDFFVTHDKKRRACESRLFYTSNLLHSIFSAPYKMTVVEEGAPDISDKKESCIVQRREAFLNEFFMREGMGGGITFCDDQFVGLISPKIKRVKGATYNGTCFESGYSLVNCLIFATTYSECCPYYIRPNSVHEGMIAVSIHLGEYRYWIEGNRQRFDAFHDDDVNDDFDEGISGSCCALVNQWFFSRYKKLKTN
jgi:hypothetical protein